MLSKSALERLTGNYAPQTMVNEIANSHLDLYALLAEKEKEIGRLQREKEARMYYQDIVYDVCTMLDHCQLHTLGHGIVCGDLEHPSKEVQLALRQSLAELGKKEG